MKLNLIQKLILSWATKIINKHQKTDNPSELSPFLMDLMEISLAFDNLISHLVRIQEPSPSLTIPYSEQKYKS